MSVLLRLTSVPVNNSFVSPYYFFLCYFCYALPRMHHPFCFVR